MEISLDITDDVGLIHFDDGKKNAFTLDGIKNLAGAFDEAEASAKAIVLAGRPGSFCAGFDLATMMGEDKAAVRELGQGGGRLALRMYQCGKPLVAACTGHAFTIGCLWLLASDTRVGEDGRFKFSMIETQVGMPLTPWAFTLLEAKLSKRHYTAAVVQSKVYDPHGAVDAGFLDEVVGEGESTAKALERAGELAKLPGHAYAANKLQTRQEGIEVMKRDLPIGGPDGDE